MAETVGSFYHLRVIYPGKMSEDLKKKCLITVSRFFFSNYDSNILEIPSTTRLIISAL